MLRISTDQAGTTTTLKLEGRLGGPWVDELERAWFRLAASSPRQIVVDISEISFADAEACKLLQWMWQQGATLKGSGCMCADLVERIKRAGSEMPYEPRERRKGR